jgi:hypothetical protein
MVTLGVMNEGECGVIMRRGDSFSDSNHKNRDKKNPLARKRGDCLG